MRAIYEGFLNQFQGTREISSIYRGIRVHYIRVLLYMIYNIMIFYGDLLLLFINCPRNVLMSLLEFKLKPKLETCTCA